jgi:hypothetical protein
MANHQSMLKLLNIYETIAVATDELGAVEDCEFPALVQAATDIHQREVSLAAV